MKFQTIRILFLIFTIASFTLLKAQNCNQIHFTKGASYEMESYDGKNNKTGVNKSVVKEVTVNGAKKEATIHSENYNKKNEKESEGDLKMICENGKLSIDMSGMFNSSQMGNNPNMTIKAETQYIEVPANISVGQTLPDAKAVMKMVDKSSGMEFAAMTMTISNRKVEGKEKITTPAGTFDCFKITFDTNVESVMGNGMKMPGHSVKGVHYIATDLGLMVKSQTLTDKGDVRNYQVLTKYSK